MLAFSVYGDIMITCDLCTKQMNTSDMEKTTELVYEASGASRWSIRGFEKWLDEHDACPSCAKSVLDKLTVIQQKVYRKAEQFAAEEAVKIINAAITGKEISEPNLDDVNLFNLEEAE